MNVSDLSSQDWRLIQFAIDRLRSAAEEPDPQTNEIIPLPTDVSDSLIHISKVAQAQIAPSSTWGIANCGFT